MGVGPPIGRPTPIVVTLRESSDALVNVNNWSYACSHPVVFRGTRFRWSGFHGGGAWPTLRSFVCLLMPIPDGISGNGEFSEYHSLPSAELCCCCICCRPHGSFAYCTWSPRRTRLTLLLPLTNHIFTYYHLDQARAKGYTGKA